MDREEPRKKLKRHGGAREQIIKVFNKIENQESDSYLKCKVNQCKCKKIPYGNVLSYQVSHAKYSEDLLTINLEALKNLEPLQLFNYCSTPQTDQTLTYSYLFHRWASDFHEIPPNKLKHCIHAYIFKYGKFFETSSPDDDSLQREVDDLLFEDFKTYNQDYEKRPVVVLHNLLSDHLVTLHQKTKFFTKKDERKAIYCDHSEEYDTPTMLQMIHDAYVSNHSYDYKYFMGHDVILLRFHPQMGYETIGYKYYNIETPVCYRDFVNYVVTTKTDWLYKEEESYWMSKRKEEELPEYSTSIDDAYVVNEADFILPGTIKDRLLQQKLAEQQGQKGGKKGSVFFI